MKKHIGIILITLLSTGIFVSCNEDDVSKDYAASIKDKTWWGELTNAGEGGSQYYSVYFNANNTLVWSQLAGDYGGQWLLDKNKLTLTFTGLDVIMTAEISDDDTWTNITTNTPNKVNSGELAVNPNMNLDNTLWSGMERPINASGISLDTNALQMRFSPNFTYTIRAGEYTAIGFTYEKSPFGGFFRLNKISDDRPDYFGVIVSDREIRGTNSDLFTFQLMKQ
jgi:hypothetical protein